MQFSSGIQLSSITLCHFKSYAYKTSLPLNDQFVCITGKNGCGKSALIDGICCCLGVDKNRLRISNYSECITHLDNQIYDNCSIELVFEDSYEHRKVATLIFTVDSSGHAIFRYNGKTITRERLRKTVLSQLGLPISPYPLFVIQQNHIQTFCVNDSSFLVNYIHEISGTNQFLSFLQDYSKQHSDIEQQLQQINKQIEEKRKIHEQFLQNQENQRKQKEIEKEIKQKRYDLKEKQELFHQLEYQILNQKYQTLQEENRQIQQQLDNIKNESIEEEWKRQEEIQEKLQQQEEKMKILQYQQDTIKQNLTVIGVDLSSIQEKQQLLQEQQKQLQMNESFLHQLQSHSISLTTLQTILQNPSYQKTFNTLQTSIQELHTIQTTLTQYQSQSQSNHYEEYQQDQQSLLTKQVSLRNTLLHNPSSTLYPSSADYMGLLIEHFTFKDYDPIYIPCFLQLFYPFRFIHLCMDYTTSSDLLHQFQYSNQTIRVWVFEQINRKYSNQLPAMIIQEGTIELIHPLSFCTLSNPSLYPLYNAIIGSTYFLNTKQYPLSNPSHMQSLQKSLSHYSIRVITTEGIIHSKGMLIGGQIKNNYQEWQILEELSKISNQIASYHQQEEEYKQIKQAIQDLELKQTQLQDSIHSLQQQISILDNSTLFSTITTINPSLFLSCSSYESLEQEFIHSKQNYQQQEDYLESQALSLSIQQQAIQQQFESTQQSLHSIHQTILSYQQELQTISHHISFPQQQYKTLLIKQQEKQQEMKQLEEKLEKEKLEKEKKKKLLNQEKKENMEEIQQAIQRLQEQVSSLSTQLKLCQIHPVQNTIKGHDIDLDEYQTLVEHRDIIVKGLQLIEDDVQAIQQKSQTCDLEAYQSISHDFSIFCKKLIPEKDIQMILINPQNLDDGIQIQIRNNKQDEWKSSLLELSGGQKSLVSIALILSQIKYKPFFLYILDEIDAALDEENTLRIVNLIKELVSILHIQVISISHHSTFQAESTTILKIGKDEHGSSIVCFLVS